MKKLYLSVVCLFTLGLVACNGGGSNNTAQNMPVGNPPFTGTFTPGIGNVGQDCIFTGTTEQLDFTVNESAPTGFYDDTSTFSNHPLIFSGTFNNPVNQNTTCFQGTVSYSQCGNAQSGIIQFVGCSVYLSATGQYIFRSQYYLNSATGLRLASGTVYATK